MGTNLGGGNIPFLPSFKLLQAHCNGFLAISFSIVFSSIKMVSSSVSLASKKSYFDGLSLS
jgi:hypothetical protein